ncbi:hypothetical protein [Parabacteroides distasonis]|uniref:hypothetical protein n=1 Tax=Parabacteroides distasonis TaxID=823 RepID=UPI001F2A5BC8|nr:hypothetical protein [Parabacteroides distasonis]
MREKPKDNTRLRHMQEAIQEQDIAFCDHQGIAWDEVIGMRHVLVHGYIIRFGMRLCGEPFKPIYFRLRIR